jgi:hypothetical protein
MTFIPFEITEPLLAVCSSVLVPERQVGGRDGGGRARRPFVVSGAKV